MPRDTPASCRALTGRGSVVVFVHFCILHDLS